MLSMLNGLGGRVSAPKPARVLTEGIYAEAEFEKGDSTADLVLTDNIDESWNSGRMATENDPVSLTLDLGSGGKHVDKVVLLPYQVPTPAETHHRVWLDDQLVAELKGETTHHKPLPEVPVGRTGRQLRIETVKSPSWVAWSQVKIWGSSPP